MILAAEIKFWWDHLVWEMLKNKRDSRKES